MGKDRCAKDLKTGRCANMDGFERAHDLLCREFGHPDLPAPLPVLEELVFTVLSQNTNDRNRDKAWQRLKQKYSLHTGKISRINWRMVLESDLSALGDVIRVAGLGATKSETIKRVLKAALQLTGSFDMQIMSSWQPAQVFEYLVAIPGVGPKTANCVLCFSLDMPAFPVDTHVLRVLKRTGLAGPEGHKLDMSAANRKMTHVVPVHIHKELHLNFIRLGRSICGSRKAECSNCPLLSLPCPGHGAEGMRKR